MADILLHVRYAKGDIIIFHSAALWHMVAPWRAPIKGRNALLSPGRIGRVYTVHQETFDRLLRDDWYKLVRPGRVTRKLGKSGRCK